MSTSVSPHPVTPAKGSERSGLARLWHQLGPGSRKRHARARVESQWLAALRYQWQQACQHVGLGLMIYTPSGSPSRCRGSSGPTSARRFPSPSGSGQGREPRTSPRRHRGWPGARRRPGSGSPSARPAGCQSRANPLRCELLARLTASNVPEVDMRPSSARSCRVLVLAPAYAGPRAAPESPGGAVRHGDRNRAEPAGSARCSPCPRTGSDVPFTARTGWPDAGFQNSVRGR